LVPEQIAQPIPIKVWLSAFRLRTLPLSFASIILGGALATSQFKFRVDVFSLCLLTTLFLQVLSNLANDYGDSIHGADGSHRKGPKRAVQSGAISKPVMLRAIIILAVLAFVSGVTLLLVALKERTYLIPYFLGLGVAAIAAAILYTNGKRPYGYQGLGDISVFTFFGPVAVLGTWFLQSDVWETKFVFAAIGEGLLATGVLNVNNIRDIESDTFANKRSIPVLIGRKNALYYHFFLVIVGFLLVNIAFFDQIGIASIALIIGFGQHITNMRKAKSVTEYDPELKKLSLSTLLLSVLIILIVVWNLYLLPLW